MLGINQTALLLDGLKPPPGTRIDVAIGTTFTLDLTALLAVPVAATFSEEEQDEDSASLLETIRSYADRTVLFCQAGAISVPPQYRAALTLLEQSVVEVKKPPGGIFHPKLWVIRFADDTSFVHRVLVMTRNLTFDRSWDVIARFDESDDAEVVADPAGIVRLLTELPRRTARRLTDDQTSLLADVTRTLRSARLAVPEPFESASFVPLLGTGRRRTPFHSSCDHALAISPFLTGWAAESFLSTATIWNGVVSRASAMDASADALRDVDRVMRMQDAVLEAERTIDDTFDTGDVGAAPHLRGLHAKTYVQDVGDRSTVWIGSANLTTGAFSTNTEILTRLTGPTAKVGVDVLLSPDPRPDNLSGFVEDHELADAVPEESDDEISELDACSYDIASAQLVLTLTEVGDHWDAALAITPWAPPDGVTVRARLLSLDDASSVDVTEGTANWSSLPPSLITPFVVIEVNDGHEPQRSLIRADLVGDQEDRRRRVIANAISSRDDFLRYLAALLGTELGLGAFGGFGGGGEGWTGSSAGGLRILEHLLTTASRTPARLVTLEDTLRHLRDRPDGDDIVPEDFPPVWEAVNAAVRRRKPRS